MGFDKFLEKFSGDNDESVDEWFMELERVFEPYNINETSKYYNTRQLLTGTEALGIYREAV